MGHNDNKIDLFFDDPCISVSCEVDLLEINKFKIIFCDFVQFVNTAGPIFCITPVYNIPIRYAGEYVNRLYEHILRKFKTFYVEMPEDCSQKNMINHIIHNVGDTNLFKMVEEECLKENYFSCCAIHLECKIEGGFISIDSKIRVAIGDDADTIISKHFKKKKLNLIENL